MKVNKAAPFIFFLTLSKNLPKFYMQAANIFNGVGITLIPVNMIELNDIRKGEKNVNIIVYTSCLSELLKFYKLRQSGLDMGMNNQKFCLFHITSFGVIMDLSRAKRLQSYYNLALPDYTKDICYNIASKVFKRHEQLERWPGGRRAKLPFQSISD